MKAIFSSVFATRFTSIDGFLFFVAGLDRLISIYAKTNSIRDVIAFPKTAAGNDLMSSSPCSVPKSDLDFYHISVNKDTFSVSDNLPDSSDPLDRSKQAT